MRNLTLSVSASLLLSVSTFAQAVPALRDAGGTWMSYVSTDALTDASSMYFVLEARNKIGSDGTQSRPRLVLRCAAEGKPPRLEAALFIPGLIVGTPDDHSAVTGAPQMRVTMRTDGKMKWHWWNVAADWQTMFMDKGAVKDALQANDLRIQFNSFAGYEETAQFAPTGLGKTALQKACGITLK